MHEALFAGSDLHEGAEGHESGNDALVDGADLGILRDGLHDIQSALCVFDILSGDVYGAVLFNVDLAVALGADLLDDLALFADDVADLVNVGDEVIVKVLPIDEQGRLNLSRRDALIEVEGRVPDDDDDDQGRRPRRGGNDRRGGGNRYGGKR